MFKLLVLITFISGISTRGVPVADDINGQHVEPERTETDNKDRTSEHVAFEECEGNQSIVTYKYSFIFYQIH